MSILTDRIAEVLRAHMVCACGNTGEDMECCSYVAERVVEALDLTAEPLDTPLLQRLGIANQQYRVRGSFMGGDGVPQEDT